MSQLATLERRTVEVTAAHSYTEIGVRSFGRGLFIKPPVTGSELGAKRVFRVHQGDLVVSNVFGWEGAVAVAGPEHADLIGSHRFMTWSPQEGVDARYLFHYLVSEAGLVQLGAASPGSAGRNRTLAIKNFEQIVCPLPSLPDQRRIAAHLNAIEQTQDTLRTAHDRCRRHAEALAQGLWRSVSGDSLPLGEILRPSREPLKLDDDSTYAAIGMKSFGKGLIEYPPVRAEQLSKLRYFRLSPDRLVLSNIKAWEGAVGMTGPCEKGRIASNRFLQMQLTREGSLSYIRHWLLSSAGIHALNIASPGSADRNRTLSLERLQSISIPWPEASVQNQLADLLDAATEIAHEQRSLVLAEALLPAARNEVFNALR